MTLRRWDLSSAKLMSYCQRRAHSHASATTWFLRQWSKARTMPTLPVCGVGSLENGGGPIQHPDPPTLTRNSGQSRDGLRCLCSGRLFTQRIDLLQVLLASPPCAARPALQVRYPGSAAVFSATTRMRLLRESRFCTAVATTLCRLT